MKYIAATLNPLTHLPTNAVSRGEDRDGRLIIDFIVDDGELDLDFSEKEN